MHEGDIHDLIESVPAHDLLTGGFPCQPFSSAGKKRGTRDPRGTLFQSIVDIIKRQEPSYFVLENVKRLLSMEDGSHFATILDALASLDYRVEWRLLNAMHFGLAQNRQRIIILGVHSRVRAVGEPQAPRLATTDDLKVLSARDVVEYMSPGLGWTKIESHSKKFPTWGVACNGSFFSRDLPKFHQAQPIPVLRSVLQSEEEVGDEFDFTESTTQRLASNETVDRFVQGVEIISNQGGGARMGYTIFGTEGVAPTLTSSTSRHYERYKIGSRYRRLTNIEYARLQGFPDDHCCEATVYDQYILFGNAVPPPMTAWVLGRLNASDVTLPLAATGAQIGLFDAS
jgi:DNA (cytosine-5)-methyltransferase 1